MAIQRIKSIASIKPIGLKKKKPLVADDPDKPKKKRRIGIKELNARGFEALKEHEAEIKAAPDRRSAVEKVLDIIDMPRNVVANLVADISGLDRSKLGTASAGMKRVNFSDLLKQGGVENKVARGIVGFVGDVALDPLTYLSLGSTTGLSLAKGAPKLLKSGQKAARTASKAMTTGKAVAPEIAGALGKSSGRLTKIGGRMVQRNLSNQIKALNKGLSPRDAMKQAGDVLSGKIRPMAGLRVDKARAGAASSLFGKRGGKLTSSLVSKATPGIQGEDAVQAARQFLGKHGEKGRTIARLPFAAKGIGYKGGKRGRLAQEFAGDLDPRAAAQVGRQQDVLSATRKTTAKTATAQAKYDEATDAIRQTMKKQSEDLGWPVDPTIAEDVIRKDPKIRKLRDAVKAAKDPKQIDKARRMALGPATSPMTSVADESMKMMARGKLGKMVHPAPVGGAGAKDWGRAVKQQLFGPGKSQMHQKELGSIRARGQGARLAEDVRRAEFAQPVRDIVEEAAKRSGKSYDEAMESFYNFTEFNEAYRKADPARRTIGTERALFGGIEGADDLAVKIRQAFDDDVIKLREAGVPQSEIDDYLRRVVNKDAKKAIDPNIKRIGDSKYSPHRTQVMELRDDAGNIYETKSFNGGDAELAQIQRGLPEGHQADVYPASTRFWNQEAQDVGKGGQGLAKTLMPPEFKGVQFDTDITESLAKNASARAQSEATAGVRDMAQKYALDLDSEVARTSDEFRHYNQFTVDKASPAAHILGDLDGKFIPPQVKDMLDRFQHVAADQNASKSILKASDKMFGYWKGVTLMHPAYTARNIVQNLFGGLMSGGNPAKIGNASSRGDIPRIVGQLMRGEQITGKIRIAGRSVPAEDFAKLLSSNNFVGAGLGGEAVAQTGLHNIGRKGGGPLRQWFNLNNKVENSMKAATFWSFLDDGMDVNLALEKTMQAMPDLTDLSRFEKGAMQRVFPWYSWLRKNGAVQAFHYLPEKPAFIAGGSKFQNAMQEAFSGGVTVPVEYMPEWMKDQQGIQISGDEQSGQTFLLANWLPFQELTRLGAGMIDPQEGFKVGLEQMRPGAKFGVEMATGRDLFKQQPIERKGIGGMIKDIPSALAGRSGTPLDNLLSIRPIRESAKVAMDVPTVGGKIQRGVLGGAIQPVNAQKGMTALSYELRKKAMEIRANINRAQSAGDQPTADALIREWTALMHQLQQLGGAGVAKSTQEMMQ